MELIRELKQPTEIERAFAAAKYAILKRELLLAATSPLPDVAFGEWAPDLPIVDIDLFPAIAISSQKPEKSYIPFTRQYRRHIPRVHSVRTQEQILFDKQREEAERRRAVYFQSNRA